MYRSGRNCLNLNKAMFEGIGKYDIPAISPVKSISTNVFLGFNYVKSCNEPENKGVHFFLDDYQFSRLWTNPSGYVSMLSKFKCVCTPDFSTYTDFPLAIQIYNHYRKHWLGAYWQKQGITVVPTISWSGEDSFDWCFDGEPKGGVIALSSVGTQKNRNAKQLFLNGYRETLKRLEPTTILFYGAVPEECRDERVVHIDAFQHDLRKRCKKIRR